MYASQLLSCAYDFQSLSLLIVFCSLKINYLGDFPGGPAVKNLPSNTGDTGSIPGQGTKIPHTVGQGSPRAAATDAHALKPMLLNKKSLHAVQPRASTAK